MQPCLFTEAPISSEKSPCKPLGSARWPGCVPWGTSRQSRRALPWRMRWHCFLVRQMQLAYTLWCEVRTLFARIRTPRSRTGFLLPSEYLDTTLVRDRLVRSSAISASIAHIESVKAQMPWASLFDLSLVLHGWAAGAAWGVAFGDCKPVSRTDSCSEQKGNDASMASNESGGVRRNVE